MYVEQASVFRPANKIFALWYKRCISTSHGNKQKMWRWCYFPYYNGAASGPTKTRLDSNTPKTLAIKSRKAECVID